METACSRFFAQPQMSRSEANVESFPYIYIMTSQSSMRVPLVRNKTNHDWIFKHHRCAFRCVVECLEGYEQKGTKSLSDMVIPVWE